MKKNPSPRIAALIFAGCALLLTGCQAGTPAFDRTLNVTSLPKANEEAPDTVPEKAPGTSAGLDLHFGPASIGFICSTDSISTGTSGTAAVLCSWKTNDR